MLCGAHLAAKLLEATMSTFQITGLEQWTDSTITLQWLSQLPRTWTTFVANRVSYIQEIIKRDSWNHVPTNDNPADLASRGESQLKIPLTLAFGGLALNGYHTQNLIGLNLMYNPHLCYQRNVS